MVMRTGEPAAPALLPSNAWNSTGASGPATRSNTSASAMFITPSQAANAFTVQICQPTAGVVVALELGVGRPVVALPEFLGRVERGRVEALVAAEVADRVLDLPVVETAGRARRQRYRSPEAEVHVDLAGPHRVQRPGLLSPQPQRAQPDRAHADLRREESQEVRAAVDRDLHVLDDVLVGGCPPPGIEHGGQVMRAVEGDELTVHVRAAVAAGPGPADERPLHSERPRAPEPVGVPAPQVVPDGQEVLAGAAHGLVVDLRTGVVTKPGCLRAEGADGQVQLVQAEHGAVDEVSAVPLVAAVAGDLDDRRHAVLRAGE